MVWVQIGYFFVCVCESSKRTTVFPVWEQCLKMQTKISTCKMYTFVLCQKRLQTVGMNESMYCMHLKCFFNQKKI